MTKIEQVIKIIKQLDQSKNVFIPSENSLVNKTGFSRSTVRAALSRLVGLGVLIPVQGKGYIFNEKSSPLLRSYKNQYGEGYESYFIKRRFISERHPILPGKEYYQLIKVRYKNNEPFILAYQNVPADIYLRLDEKIAEKSLFDALKKAGETISYANKTIKYLSTPTEVTYLMPRMGEKCLLLESVTYNKYNRIIEVSSNYYYPDEFTWSWTEKSFK